MKKGRCFHRPLFQMYNPYQSRLPKNCSKNMNKLMKSRYRFNAPMIADFPSQSLSIACACCR